MILHLVFVGLSLIEVVNSFSTWKAIPLTHFATPERRALGLASTFSPLWVKSNFTSDDEPSMLGASTNNATEINGSSASEPNILQQKKSESVGIGGRDGLVYDINKLKRNRVQESIKQYKEELLVLLATLDIESVPPQHHKTEKSNTDELTIGELDAIEKFKFLDQKIRELVQINPVSTTTDSNLLDGQWTFAYASERAAVDLDTYIPSPSSISTKRLSVRSKFPKHTEPSTPETIKHHVGEPWKIKQNTEGAFRTSIRDVHLEDLDDSEDPYIIDQTRVLGGLLMFEMRYDVRDLTRKTLHICPMEYNVYFFSKWKWIRSPKMTQGQIQVLYLDSDVCICRPIPEGNDIEGPLFLYTKKEIWVGKKAHTYRKMRLLRQVPSFVKSRIQKVIRNKRKIDSRNNAKNDLPQKETVLVEKRNPSSTISMLKIGEIPSESESGWSIDDDPFSHFSLEERNEKMKHMSIEDIEKAGLRQREKSRRQRERKYKTPKKIRRPDSS